LESTIPVDELNQHLNYNNILNLKVVSKEKNLVQFAVTENRTKEDLDYLVQTVEVLK
jgi:glycine cleavage system pyridoxal-binding protein P